MAAAQVAEPLEKVGLEAVELGKLRSKETFGTIPEFIMSLQRGIGKRILDLALVLLTH